MTSHTAARLALTSVTSTTLGLFGPILAYQFYQKNKQGQLSDDAKKFSYYLMAGVFFLHLSEAIQSLYYGLTLREYTYILNENIPTHVLLPVGAVVGSIGQMLLVTSVISRTLSLSLSGTKNTKSKKWGHPAQIFTMLSVLRFLLMPLSFMDSIGYVGPVLLCLLVDLLIYFFASFVSYRTIARKERTDLLPQMSRWTLYSNVTVTNIMGLLTFCFLSVVLNDAINKDAQARLATTVARSLYHLISGFILSFFYWDTNELIRNSGSKSGLKQVVAPGVSKNVYGFNFNSF